MNFNTLPSAIAAIVFGLLCLYPCYKIYVRAGLKPYYAFFVLIPFIGLLLTTSILAHSHWTTVPPLKKKESK